MEGLRKPYQGLTNIIRFNWPFYVMAFFFVFTLITYSFVIQVEAFKFPIRVAAVLFTLPVLVSLLVSYYVYDLSGLYNLNWLPKEDVGKKIININAGFDETSVLLRRRYPSVDLSAFDFYDPLKHTEPSIKRARKSYPPYKGTISITTSKIPLEKESVDTAYVIFAAHEIRDAEERIAFFKELYRTLKPKGLVIVSEHLRDLPNFMAYTVGFFHFLPLSSWYTSFDSSGFKIKEHKKHTPFVNIFILEKHGITF